MRMYRPSTYRKTISRPDEDVLCLRGTNRPCGLCCLVFAPVREVAGGQPFVVEREEGRRRRRSQEKVGGGNQAEWGHKIFGRPARHGSADNENDRYQIDSHSPSAACPLLSAFPSQFLRSPLSLSV